MFRRVSISFQQKFQQSKLKLAIGDSQQKHPIPLKTPTLDINIKHISYMQINIQHSNSVKKKFSLISQEVARDLVEKNAIHIKTIAALNQQIQEEKNKTSNLEKELEKWKKRLVERQIELRQIISVMNSDKEKSNPMSPSKDKIPNFISSLHNEIKNKIQQNSNQTIKWMQNKEKSSIEYMDKKLQNLKKQMQQKLHQQKTLTMQNFKHIMAEIEDVRSTALVIDQQNNKLLSELKGLRIKNKILVEERNMAVNENVVNNMKMKQMMKTLQSTKTKQKSLNQSRRFRSQRNSINNSFGEDDINHNINFNRFLGEPIFDSPKQKTYKDSKKLQTPQFKKVPQKSNEKQYRSILSLQRSLKREKKRNFEMCTMFAQSFQKNNQLNQILWESMDHARREAENGPKTFHTCVVDNLLRSEQLIRNIEKIRQQQKVPVRQRQCNIGLTDLEDII